jgi:hypothetical protein
MERAYDKSRQPDDVEDFKYFGSWTTNYAKYTCKIKSRIVMVKQHSKRRTLFTNKYLRREHTCATMLMSVPCIW